MAQLTEDECDFVAEESGGIIEAAGKSVDGRDSGRQIGRRGKVSKGKHGSVPHEEGDSCVHQLVSKLFDSFLGFGRWWGRVDRGEVANKGVRTVTLLY